MMFSNAGGRQGVSARLGHVPPPSIVNRLMFNLFESDHSFGYNPCVLADQARLIESLGYDSYWTGEAYGGDAVTALR